MKEKIYKYIHDTGQAVPPEELLHNIFAMKSAKSAVADQIIQASLDGDDRFVRTDDGKWNILGVLSIRLTEMRFSLCQLTPEHTDHPSQIRSLAISQFENGDMVFEKVWNITWSESHHDSSNGIMPALQVFTEFVRVLQDSIVVMDGFGNQVTMLHNAVRWLLGYDFENEIITLRRIFQRLGDERNVSDVYQLCHVQGIEYFESTNPQERLKNLTNLYQDFWERLLVSEIKTFDDFRDFYYPEKKPIDYSKYAFDKEYIITLPECPGVYLMMDDRNQIIYVGKAKNLNQRVNSYFLNRENYDEKTEKIINQLYDLKVIELGSELEALLEEQHLIALYKPVINRQLEVHARTRIMPEYHIVFLPSRFDDSVEMFLIGNGNVKRITAHKDLNNIDAIQSDINRFFFSDNHDSITDNDVVSEQAMIALNWLYTHKDDVNLIEMKWISNLKDCIDKVKEMITQFSHEKTVYV